MMPIDQEEAHDKGHKRRLLPATAPPPTQPAASAASSASTSSTTPVSDSSRVRVPPKRSLVHAACSSCRNLKIKCPGQRPACSRCAGSRIECIYPTLPGETRSGALRRSHVDLQDRSAAQATLLDLLTSLPEHEAQDLLQRVRSGADLMAVYNQVMVGDVLLQIAVAPETRFRYTLPYRDEIPQEFIHNNPYLDSVLYQTTSLSLPSHSPQYRRPRGAHSPTAQSVDSMYMKPFHAARVVDPLLTDVRPSRWTAVSNDDKFMRELLAELLHCEYSFTSAFHKDLFLQDMATGKTDFCSSLLVNVVLAYACVCSPKLPERAEYWNPRALVYRFLVEAKRIWELEAQTPRLTTIQAGVVLNVFHHLAGLDEIGQVYRVTSISMAQKMGLFDGPIDETDERIRHGKIYTAWALYSWEALIGFTFMIPPLLTKPPEDPLPDPIENRQWYGEVWVKYPSQQNLTPLHFGHVFKTKCDFRIIMQQFSSAAYETWVEVSVEEVYELYAQLMSWHEHLPSPLRAKKIVFPNHLQLHIYVQHLLLALYEPLLDTPNPPNPSPKAIIAEATRNLQTLIRLYYLRHGFEAMDLFVVVPLTHSGFRCLDAINDRTPPAELGTLRSTLMLVVNGLYSQRKHHHLSEALYRVIRSRMRPQEILLLREVLDLGEDEPEEEELRQAVRSHWPVTAVKRKEDVDGARLGNLAGRLSVQDRQQDGAPVEKEPR